MQFFDNVRVHYRSVAIDRPHGEFLDEWVEPVVGRRARLSTTHGGRPKKHRRLLSQRRAVALVGPVSIALSCDGRRDRPAWKLEGNLGRAFVARYRHRELSSTLRAETNGRWRVRALPHHWARLAARSSEEEASRSEWSGSLATAVATLTCSALRDVSFARAVWLSTREYIPNGTAM